MNPFLPGSEHYIAIDNMACFPTTAVTLRDGSLAAFVYNHPSHVRGPRSGIEMWVSTDGVIWGRRSLATEEADWAHANHAAGINEGGDLVVVVGRYRITESQGRTTREPLDPVVRVSDDNGHHWTTASTWPSPLEERKSVPFGTVVPMADGALLAAGYVSKPGTLPDRDDSNSVFVMRSADGGRTWAGLSTIEPDNHNETALLRLNDGRLLAASRTLDSPFPDCQFGLGQFLGGRLDLFASADQGQTWQTKAILTFSGQHPGHLHQLRDGRILLTYGSRMPGLLGVHARLSADGGAHWSDPIILINGLDSPDCGYPATFEFDDGQLVTIYYSQSSPWHRRYHMGALRYRLE